MKVDMAASKAMDRVISLITDLKNEMHELRHDMNLGFAALDKRVVAIETRLGIIGEKRKRIYDRAIDYLFKVGYATSTFILSYLAYLMLQLHLVH
jgi:hypothetical protein